MSLGCFVEKPRLLQSRPRKTSYRLANFFNVGLLGKDGKIRESLFNMSNIRQCNNSRKEGTVAQDCWRGERTGQPSEMGEERESCPIT